MAAAEGIDPTLPPSLIWQAAMLKRERRREEMISLSLSICAGIGINIGGGDTSRVLRPFYTEREWADMERRAEEERQLMAQRQQIAKLMRLSHDRGA